MKGNVILGHLSTGEPVYDRYKSHLDDSLREIIEEALGSVRSSARWNIEEEVKFSRIIGTSNLVETSESDDIVYAKRVNRKGYSRLVKSKVGPECSTLYLKLTRAKKENAYILVTSFVGKKTPAEPLPGSDSKRLKEFWATHALCFEKVNIELDTLTRVVPNEFTI